MLILGIKILGGIRMKKILLLVFVALSVFGATGKRIRKKVNNENIYFD